MSWREIPSLNSLRAFVVVAQHKSLSAAGRELNVTHAAISQQIRGLESFLGRQLVEREGRGIALTPEGQRLFQGVRRGFDTIRETVEEFSADDVTRPLNISMTPSFAISWLMPRINDFRLKHPEIELMLNPTAELVELRPGATDLAIRFGAGNWPGLDSRLFLETSFVVVGASSLIGETKINQPEDLLSFLWLQELGTNEITLWMERQGVVPSGKLDIIHLPGYMVLEGLRRGDGISATAKAFIDADVAAGTMKVLFEEAVRKGAGYHLVYRSGVQRPPLKKFIEWLWSMREEQKTS